MIMFVGDEDVDEQLLLRDDTIFHLKQEMSTMQQRIMYLKSEIEEMKGRQFLAPIKHEGMYVRMYAYC